MPARFLFMILSSVLNFVLSYFVKVCTSSFMLSFFAVSAGGAVFGLVVNKFMKL